MWRELMGAAGMLWFAGGCSVSSESGSSREGQHGEPPGLSDSPDPGCADCQQEPAIDGGDSRSPALSGMADLVVMPPSGTFVGNQEVSFSALRPGVEVRIGTDGAPVTATSPIAPDPLVVTESTELRVRQFVDGAPIGEELTRFYLLRDFELTVDVPVLVIDSLGEPAPEREYQRAVVMSFENPGATLAEPPTIASRAGFHLRGQSTSSFEKPPYRLELRDGDDQDADHPLLGLPEESDWALRGPFADKALIRDAFFYGLGADMGIAAPKFAHVELYRNVGGGPLSQDDYLGVYLLVETIKNSKNRLDLSQLDELDVAAEQLSGGYIFKFEWLAAEDPILPCPAGDFCWNDLEVHDPATLAPEQSEWLAGHLRQFVDVLYSPTFADPSSGYAAWIEPDSFVDQFIINELGREMDSYIRSAYFHKDRDGKIVAGPLWDYNLSLDVGGFFDNRLHEGFQVEHQREPIANDWMARLLEDPAFQQRVNVRWGALRQSLLSDAQLDARIDDLTAPLAQAAERNFIRWPNLTDEMVGPFQTPTAPTWSGQVEVIRTWVKARAAWLDTVWQ